jgi:hypothetical protein
VAILYTAQSARFTLPMTCAYCCCVNGFFFVSFNFQGSCNCCAIHEPLRCLLIFVLNIKLDAIYVHSFVLNNQFSSQMLY